MVEPSAARLASIVSRSRPALPERQLGRHEDLVARQAALAQRAADAGLVAVHRRRVDVAVADLERAQRRGLGPVASQVPKPTSGISTPGAIVVVGSVSGSCGHHCARIREPPRRRSRAASPTRTDLRHANRLPGTGGGEVAPLGRRGSAPSNPHAHVAPRHPSSPSRVATTRGVLRRDVRGARQAAAALPRARRAARGAQRRGVRGAAARGRRRRSSTRASASRSTARRRGSSGSSRST